LGKIAVGLDHALSLRAMSGGAAELTPRPVAAGDGWTVEDVICTSGPQDRSFEERHSCFRLVIVGAGTFGYRSHRSRELMTPGSLLFGNAGQCFECEHDHGSGDRCLSFGLAPDYFERLAADAGVRPGAARFEGLRVPPIREVTPILSAAGAAWMQPADSTVEPMQWEELLMTMVARSLDLTQSARPSNGLPLNAEAAVARAIRLIDEDPAAPLTLRHLASHARLSPYHFLRTFRRLTGVTPHQFVLRARLREAATRLRTEASLVLDVALDCGFGDLSNFNHAFRAEFGVSPRAYRRGEY
jgi:AraC-like DNA-binding protein